MSRITALLLVTACAVSARGVHAGTLASLEAYAVRTLPQTVDAKAYARAGWGAGAQFAAPLPGTRGLGTLVLGGEVVNLLAMPPHRLVAPLGLRYDFASSVDDVRLVAGLRFEAPRFGIVRPYAGAGVAGARYVATSVLSIPNPGPLPPDLAVQRGRRTSVALGLDGNAGVQFDLLAHWSLDVAVCVRHHYGVMVPVGHDAVRTEPGELQYRFGLVHFPSGRAWRYAHARRPGQPA